MRLSKAWTGIDKLSVKWKSDLSDKIKGYFFQAEVVSIQLYGCTTWTLTKCIYKKLDGNCSRMLRAILNTSWKQHSTKRQLYGHLLPISKTIKIKRTRYVGHCWRSKVELIRDVLQWTPSHRRASVGWPARPYLQQLCIDTGCSLEDLPEAMDDRDRWRERVKEIRASSMTSWWWYIYIYIRRFVSRWIISRVSVYINISIDKATTFVCLFGIRFYIKLLRRNKLFLHKMSFWVTGYITILWSYFLICSIFSFFFFSSDRVK